jgi:hypothetical protein
MSSELNREIAAGNQTAELSVDFDCHSVVVWPFDGWI